MSQIAVNAIDVTSGDIEAAGAITGAPTASPAVTLLGAIYMNSLPAPASVYTLLQGSDGGSNRIQLVLNSAGQLVLILGSNWVEIGDGDANVTAGQWVSFGFSASYNALPASRTTQIIINGSAPTKTLTNTGGAFTMDWSAMTPAAFKIGDFDGAISMPAIIADVALNFTASGNAIANALFAGKIPLYDIGRLTSLCGKTPELFFPKRAATFEVNAGSGGDHGRNGTLTDEATTPLS